MATERSELGIEQRADARDPEWRATGPFDAGDTVR